MTTTTTSFWSSFSTFLAGEVTKAETEIKSMITYFTPLVEAGAQEVAQTALAAVLQQAPLVLAGTEKLANATSSVISTLASSGKSVAINIAEGAVQAAYNSVAATAAPKPAA
jgi:hypothetical protein